MTDEEKKAIEDLKEVVELYNNKCLITTEDDFKSIEILLNLIEKGENVKLRLQDIPLIEGELQTYKDRVNELKQELEKEKEKNKITKQMNENLIEALKESISKDKIKAKIEDILNSENGEAIEKLIEWQSLLEKE